MAEVRSSVRLLKIKKQQKINLTIYLEESVNASYDYSDGKYNVILKLRDNVVCLEPKASSS